MNNTGSTSAPGMEDAEKSSTEEGAAVASSDTVPRWKRWRKRMTRGVLVCVAGVLLYIAAGLALPWIPVNTDFRPDPEGITIAVMSNGVHTDLVLPLTCDWHSWWDRLSPDDIPGDASRLQYVALGWGNREFYLETPTWADVRISLVLRAMVGVGETAVHADFLTGLPAEGDRCRHLSLSQDHYQLLVKNLEATFHLDDNGRARSISGAHYHHADAFYEARGRYHLLQTCNVWTGQILRKSGIRVGLWTPFPAGVFTQLPST